MIGGDSYVFNTDKSIATGFQTLLGCQLPCLATFVPHELSGTWVVKIRNFKLATEEHDWWRFLSFKCREIDCKGFPNFSRCVPRIQRPQNLIFLVKCHALFVDLRFPPKATDISNVIMLGIVFYDTRNRRVKVRLLSWKYLPPYKWLIPP